MLKFVRNLSLVLVVIVLLVVGAIVWLLATESGARFALARAESFLPDGLSIGQLEGRVIGPLTARDVRFDTEGFELTLASAQLSWQPRALLGMQVQVDTLEAEGLRYRVKPVDPPVDAEPFSLPDEIKLPVKVFVAEARLRDVIVISGPDAEPLIVDSLGFALAWTNAVQITQLELRAPLADVQGQLAVTPEGDYKTNAELDFELRLPELHALQGKSRIDGSLDRLNLSLTTLAPYNTAIDGFVTDVLATPAFDLGVVIREAKLNMISAAAPPASLSADAEARGDLSQVALTFEATGTDESFGELKAVFSGEVSPEVISFDRLDVGLVGTQSQLTARGRVELSGAAPKVDVNGEWTAMQWPLRGVPTVSSKLGKLQVSGVLDDYVARLDAEVLVPEQSDGKVQLRGRGDSTQFTIDSLSAQTLNGTLQGTGAVAWSPALAGNVDLSGRNINPGLLLPEWPGNLAFKLKAQGGVPEAGPEGVLKALRVEGELRGQAVVVDAEATFENGILALPNFVLSSGSTKLNASGKIGDVLDLDFAIASDDLGSLIPDASGQLNAQGRASGSLTEPQVVLQLEAEQLSYTDFQFATLKLDADVSLAEDQASKLMVDATDGVLAGTVFGQLSLDGSGTRADHIIKLSSATIEGDSEVVINGALTETTDYAFTLGSLPFALLAPWLPENLRAEGTLAGAGSVSLNDGRVQANAEFKSSPLKLLSPGERSSDDEDPLEWQPLVEFDAGLITLNAQPDGELKLVFDLPLAANAGGIKANAMIAGGAQPLTARELSGQLITALPDIDFFADFVPEVETLAGSLDGDIRLTGTLEAPELNGALTLSNGQAALLTPQITVREINATLKGQGSGELALEFNAKSGGGPIKIQGDFDVLGEEMQANLTATGSEFRVANTPEVALYASPDVKLVLKGNKLSLTGEVKVPRADINLQKVPESAVGVSSDQVIVRAEEGEAADVAALEVSARIRLLLGDDVRFEGFGLKARFAGNLTVVEQPGEPTTGTGEVRIAEGQYEAYGQQLDIERGKVIFVGGPLDQPGVDVRAVRQPAPDITVGVWVRGTLKSPEFSLFSDPSMSESDRLSYLVVGRPLQSNSSAESSALSRAALALGIKGGNFLTDQFGGKLGVDQIGIETAPGESNEQAALVVGKYLSPKLFVSYGIGLLEPVTTLKLQYTLSSKWRLVTESSSLQSGGDAIYTIERD